MRGWAERVRGGDEGKGLRMRRRGCRLRGRGCRVRGRTEGEGRD